MRQLQGMDASFVALETKNSPMHIGSLLIYNPETAPGGFVRYKDILAFYESRLQLSRTVRQRLVRVPFELDYPYWIEDPDFDLRRHVRHTAVPAPGGTICHAVGAGELKSDATTEKRFSKDCAKGRAWASSQPAETTRR